MQKMEMVAFGTSRLLSIVSVLFKPIVFLLTASTNAVLHLLHISTEDNEQVSEEEIRMILATSSSNGGIEAGENEMIQKVFDLNDIPIKDICTHRKEIIGLSMEDGLEDWKETIQNNHQSFYPVYGETIDEVYGVLDVKMYFRSDQSSMINVLDSAVRKPYFVPAGMKADDLLREMKKRGDFFACVIDEYGTFIGIVTLRDIMEIIVGDLIEKGEEKEEEIVKLSEETWLVRGTALLSEVERELKVNLHTKENGIFSGFLIRHLGRIPRDGEELDMVIGAMNIHINKIEDHVIESANVTVERK